MLFATVLTSMHDYTNQFNMKWKKNQFGGRKVVLYGKEQCLPNWVQKVGGRLLTLPNAGSVANAGVNFLPSTG